MCNFSFFIIFLVFLVAAIKSMPDPVTWVEGLKAAAIFTVGILFSFLFRWLKKREGLSVAEQDRILRTEAEMDAQIAELTAQIREMNELKEILDASDRKHEKRKQRLGVWLEEAEHQAPNTTHAERLDHDAKGQLFGTLVSQPNDP